MNTQGNPKRRRKNMKISVGNAIRKPLEPVPGGVQFTMGAPSNKSLRRGSRARKISERGVGAALEKQRAKNEDFLARRISTQDWEKYVKKQVFNKLNPTRRGKWTVWKNTQFDQGKYFKLNNRGLEYAPIRPNSVNDRTLYNSWLSNQRKQKEERFLQKGKVLGTKRKTTNTSRTKEDRFLIPWLPSITVGTASINTFRDIQDLPGHGNSMYSANWVSIRQSFLGVFIQLKNAGPKNRLNKAYIGNTNIAGRSTYILNNTNKTLNHLKPLLGINKFLSGKKTILKSNYTGPGAPDLISHVITYIRSKDGNLTPDDINYIMNILSLKLIGDRITAHLTFAINSNTRHCIVKPYNQRVGQLCKNFFYGGEGFSLGTQLEYNELIKELTNEIFSKSIVRGRDEIIFYNAAAYTLDRPLALYCLVNNIAFVLALGKNGDQLYSNLLNPVPDYYKNHINKVTNPILLDILSETDKVKQKHMLSIFDCFHDFGKEESSRGGAFFTFETLKYILTTYYLAIDGSLVTFFEKFTQKGDIGRAEESIPEFLIQINMKSNTALSTDIEDIIYPKASNGTYNAGSQYAFIYDSGIKGGTPKWVLDRIGGAINRVVDSASARAGSPMSNLAKV